MPFYEYSLVIPANTPQAAPEELEVKLTHGVITHFEVEFPPGCAGLAHAYIRKALHQVAPLNPDGFFKTDGRAIVWSDYYELFEEPYTLTVGGWNEDDSYPHQIIFRFELTAQEIAERLKAQAGVVDKILRLLGVR